MKIPNKYSIITFSLFGFIFFHLARQMLQVRQDGWYVGQINLYGDLVFHLGFINKFLETGKVLTDSPIFSGNKPNYPIFADFITAQVARFTGIDFALFITTFTGGLIVLYITRLFIFNFIRSNKVIFISLLLFFINGGFGFYYFFKDFLSSNQNIAEFLLHLPNNYTDLKDNGYWWINSYLAYFIPQRGFLFAFPITLIVFSLIYQGYNKHKYKYFALAGLLSGILPLIQAHSLFVIFIVSLIISPISIYFAKSRKKIILNWAIFAFITAIISLPITKIITQSSNPLEFIRLDIGWTSKENIIWFWFKNLGIFAPLLIIALTWLYTQSKRLFILYIPFLAIFVLSNIFIFQPWEFDNSKLLIYWYFVSCIVVGYFLNYHLFSEGLLKKTFGVFIILIAIFAGSLDIFRTFTTVSPYKIFTQNDLLIGESIKKLTPKNAIFVTASNHNNPAIALTGRSTVLGFHGWVWSHGLNYQQRANDVVTIYSGGEEADKLIKNYNVSYIAVGPQERTEFFVNENYFLSYPSISLGKDWVFYDVSNIWSDSNR